MTTEIIILVLLILVNGLFAMSEMAVVASRQAILRKYAEDGNTGAMAALRLAAQPTRFLSTVQIGITLIGILSGAFGGATIAQNLAASLTQLPLIGQYSEALGVAIVVTVITFFSLIIGELVPKRLALNDAEKIASALAPLLAFISRMTTPVVNFLSFTTDLILRMMGAKPVSEPAVTEEEIKILIEQGRETGVFEDMEQEIVERVFRLSDRMVNSVMTHRAEMVWLDVDDPFDVNIARIIDSGYTNYVVCQGSLDTVLGLISITEVLSEYARGEPISLKPNPDFPLIPKGTRALDVLEQLRASHSPMALVMDEFGSVVGMVTLSDMLEALVGDIPGLVAGSEPEATQRADGSWLLDGMMAVDELRMLLDLDTLPREDADYTTISGMFMAQLGRIPKAGDLFDWQDYRFEVMDMDGFRVDKVLVALLHPG